MQQRRASTGSGASGATDLCPRRDELASLTGSYEADQGGALLTLQVTLVGDALHVERTFREPTMDDHVRRYVLQAEASEALTVHGDAALRGTREGVLLWEQDSGVEGIPTGWWSLYRRVRP